MVNPVGARFIERVEFGFDAAALFDKQDREEPEYLYKGGKCKELIRKEPPCM